MGTVYTVHFWLFSVLAIGAALAMVTRRNPVAAALWLVNVMFALAALYVMLGAHFLGAVQVLVYAGAIMVVFVFVVMLLNLGENDVQEKRSMGGALAASLLGGILAAQLLLVIRRQPLEPEGALPEEANALTAIADSLFTDNLVAFEVTSVLLLVAVVGAVVLAKRGRASDEVRT
ncbi:MAG TPA: NADH-quinone oxidoreductase subunit J [Gemmatimonadaceae bacterium]|nr:NADH-quinone oxidoreductase subunit J [Gemmatimonadaceae bacterium]